MSITRDDTYMQIDWAEFMPRLLGNHFETNPEILMSPFVNGFKGSLLHVHLDVPAWLHETSQEENVGMLKKVFKVIASTAVDQGADLLQIAQTQMLCLWRVTETSEDVTLITARALQCAQSIIAAVDALHFVWPSAFHGGSSGALKVRAHCRIGTGSILELHAGGHEGRWVWFVAGPALQQISRCPHVPGVAHASNEAMDRVSERWHADEAPILPVRMTPPKSIPNTSKVPSMRDLCPDWKKEKSRLAICHMPELVAEGDYFRYSRTSWFQELNAVAMLCLCVPSIQCRVTRETAANVSNSSFSLDMSDQFDESPVSEEELDKHLVKQFAETVQNTLTEIQRILFRHGGTIMNVCMDGDRPGFRLTAAFCNSNEMALSDMARRAVNAALELKETQGCVCGVATGRVFCSTLGTKKRRDYALMGRAAQVADVLLEIAMRQLPSPAAESPTGINRIGPGSWSSISSAASGDSAERGAFRILCDSETLERTSGFFQFVALPNDLTSDEISEEEHDNCAPSSKMFRDKIWAPLRETEIVPDASPRVLIMRDLRKSEETIGREYELSVMLQSTRTLVKEGVGSLLLLEGVSGMGKSRLINDFRDLTQNWIRNIHVDAASSSFNDPYQPWGNILMQLYEATDVDALRRELERNMGTWAHVEMLVAALHALLPGSSQTRRVSSNSNFPAATVTEDNVRFIVVYFVKTKLLVHPAESANDRTRLLTIDDGHEMNSISWACLFHVARSLPQLLIVVTFRPTPSVHLEIHDQIAATPTVRHIKLKPLTLPQTRKMILTLWRADECHPAIAEAVYCTSIGTPLFIEDLQALLNSSMLVKISQKEGEKRWIEPTMAVAEFQREFQILCEDLTSMTDAISTQIEVLSSLELAVLKSCAVLNLYITESAISALLPFHIRREDIRDALAFLVESGVLLESSRGVGSPLVSGSSEDTKDGIEYSFVHSFLRDVVYKRMMPQQKSEQHKDAAAYLESLRDEGETMDDGLACEQRFEMLSLHWRHTGDSRRSLRYLIKAADTALDNRRNRKAAELYQKALTETPIPDSDLERLRRSDWERNRGLCFFRMMQPRDAIECVDRALALIRDSSSSKLNPSPSSQRVSLAKEFAKQLFHRLVDSVNSNPKFSAATNYLRSLASTLPIATRTESRADNYDFILAELKCRSLLHEILLLCHTSSIPLPGGGDLLERRVLECLRIVNMGEEIGVTGLIAPEYAELALVVKEFTRRIFIPIPYLSDKYMRLALRAIPMSTDPYIKSQACFAAAVFHIAKGHISAGLELLERGENTHPKSYYLSSHTSRTRLHTANSHIQTELKLSQGLLYILMGNFQEAKAVISLLNRTGKLRSRTPSKGQILLPKPSPQEASAPTPPVKAMEIVLQLIKAYHTKLGASDSEPGNVRPLMMMGMQAWLSFKSADYDTARTQALSTAATITHAPPNSDSSGVILLAETLVGLSDWEVKSGQYEANGRVSKVFDQACRLSKIINRMTWFRVCYPRVKLIQGRLLQLQGKRTQAYEMWMDGADEANRMGLQLERAILLTQLLSVERPSVYSSMPVQMWVLDVDEVMSQVTDPGFADCGPVVTQMCQSRFSRANISRALTALLAILIVLVTCIASVYS